MNVNSHVNGPRRDPCETPSVLSMSSVSDKELWNHLQTHEFNGNIQLLGIETVSVVSGFRTSTEGIQTINSVVFVVLHHRPERCFG